MQDVYNEVPEEFEVIVTCQCGWEKIYKIIRDEHWKTEDHFIRWSSTVGFDHYMETAPMCVASFEELNVQVINSAMVTKGLKHVLC